jgi:nucleotide-binding universal stress UspA family protein
MTYVDLLSHIDTYSTPTTTVAIDEAVAAAARLGGNLTGLAIEVDIPVRSNRLAESLIGLSAIADADGDKIGAAFDRYIKRQKPDLLAMGEDGRSRAREFLSGGATEHTLRAPACPVPLSH